MDSTAPVRGQGDQNAEEEKKADEGEGDEEDEEDDLRGMKCQAPLKEVEVAVCCELYSAIILGREATVREICLHALH